VGLQSDEYLRASLVGFYKHLPEVYRVGAAETDGGVVSGMIMPRDANSTTIALTNPAGDGNRMMVIHLEEIVRVENG
jgi:hypothetical protein